MGDAWCFVWCLACEILLNHKEPWEKLQWWWLWRGDIEEEEEEVGQARVFAYV